MARSREPSPGRWHEVRINEDRRRGFGAGLRASVPIVVGYLPAAVAFGVAARGAGLSAVESVVMSLIVYSGASQFALAGLVAVGTSWPVMAGISLILGMRHVLYGPSLVPYLRRIDTAHAATVAFGLTDEVFAVASVELRRRPAGFGWLLGLETGAYSSWALGTGAGVFAGTAIVAALPSLAPALSFALPALFVALLISLMRAGGPQHRNAPSPTVCAVLAAVVVAAVSYLAGLESWSVPAAGVIGPLVGILLQKGWAGAT
ncbi:MAG: AzlC family protein [uncultured Rubrobacteraceae bacterium]|uniref:AzlC family protein n=1 Tax=uncultured Rubrobacteraceae bacterium TaxID=349277 RepID=A0A6J4QZT2_9ACTN|nr:MAG: AzlC family protein [uncultured Rubrobacteraceae bacterium]